MRKVEPIPPAASAVPANHLQHAARAETLDELLADLRRAHDAIVSGNDTAIPEYNFLTGRLIERLEKDDLQPWGTTIAVAGNDGTRTLSGDPKCAFRVGGYDFLPTDSIEFTGKYSTRPNLQPGIGSTLVSHPEGSLDFTGPIPGDVKAKTLTALVRFEGDRALLDLLDPYHTESVRLGGRTLPLAADYVSNTSFALSATRIDKFGLIRLLRADRFSDTARITRIQPYDPDRVPVLLVHGLQDTPATFAPMYYNLMADPELRKRCQFWVFSYPSGYPYPWSAALLRRELDRMQRECPGHRDIVIVGHSMGGLLSRLMITDAGDSIWCAYFGKPPERTGVHGESRRILEEALVFHERTDIARAIFINTPHRGSELASNWIGRLGSRLVKLPTFLADMRDSAVSIVTNDPSGLVLDHVPNSIDTLSPKSRFIRAVDKLPIDPGVPYHSIIGDLGRGNTPNSSDGVVAYWSAHLEGAESERIVPTWHSGHQSAQGIDEVRQILRGHLGLPKAEPMFIPPNPNPSNVDFGNGPPGQR
ncbi:hypothetical protein Hsar01_00972 [Haloferula sargassicola]|uniref:AB hydrolase-1 domain-containing protein n=2 Tax=Haloferula sargassicola TaxID=490096 RepID=A0ABP9UM23_9BACT